MDTIETPIYNDATMRNGIDTMSLNSSKTESDVIRQVSNYDSIVSRLRETIGLLEDKIANVLSVEGDTERAAAPTSPNKSTLASMICDLNERLSYCVERLDSVIQRIDL